MVLSNDILFKDYFIDGENDEIISPTFDIKPSWNALLSNVQSIGLKGLVSRQNDLDWYLKENGVTYNVYNDPQGLNRPWNLNAIPSVIDENEWKNIEKGIQQRAELFNLILKDLYGKRELISNGIVPQEVIYSHRGFLRSCDQIEYSTEKHLLIYAADIARGPDGQMWVFSDRTQAPSGMGYALENRLTMGRVLPELSKGMNVRKLSAFFQHFNDLLIDACPRKSGNPHIVVLTPGPLNETYFEHAYLASFLGYPLVQGNDLVVRDGFLWMKSLKGLKQVDVVLRRVDDMFTDPLELREDSQLGVPGLLNVIRNRNVTIINPIGSRVLENPGLIPFMPGIANYFLNEELILPQIASWWCGQENERKYVLDHLPELIIKRIDRSQTDNVFYGYQMNNQDLNELRVQIADRPYRFVAQERISFSTTPTLFNGQFEPRYLIWRTFAIGDKHEYSIMPGGLARVAPEKGKALVSNQTGGFSKDIWIIGNEKEVDPLGIAFKNKSAVAISGLTDLPSMTAENLYWSGRYVGRSLTIARFMRMVLKQMSSSNFSERKPNTQSLELLFRTVTNITGTYPGFVGDEPIEDPYSEIMSVIMDPNLPGSLTYTLNLFSNTYYSIRNLWSADMWRVFERINSIWRNLQNDNDLNIWKITQAIDQIITRLIAFMGLVEESILIEQGLLMYFIGLQLELSMLNIAKCRSLLVVKQDEPVEYEILESLLSTHESLNIYRYSYRSFIKLENVMELIFLDVKYPRSLAFRFNRMLKDLSLLPNSKPSNELTDYEKYVLEGFTKLQLANSSELIKTDEEDQIRESLDELLSTLSDLLYKTSLTITNTYFSHTFRQTQLVNQNFSV